MTLERRRWWTVAGVAALLAGGCQQQAGDIFYRPGRATALPVEQAIEVVELAADGGAVHEVRVTTAAAGAASRPTTQPARSGYTAPGPRVQQLSFLTMVGAAAATSGIVGGGKEAAESALSAGSVSSLSGLGSVAGGMPGLGAPQPITANTVVGQPGLQRGFAAGLGFARFHNLFLPTASPLTGSTGACQDLVRLGFFPNQSACERYFGK